MKISKIFKYGSYMVLIFGFLYVSWHLGRSFEKTGAEGTAVTACAEVDDLKRVYEEVLRELEEPTPKSHWNNRYMEFTKR
jgi:hypothetical protein